MPIRDNKRLQRIKPQVVRTVKKQVIKNRVPASNNKTQKSRKYSSVIPLWKDETVYIVGGGPSLKDFDWKRLKGKKVIAINRAFQVLPDADVLYWTDSRFWKWYNQEIKQFKGFKYTCRPYSPEQQDVILLKAINTKPLSLDLAHISHGNNSGYGAINLAVLLGAKKIYLLGYDMASKDANTHWHDGYSTKHNHTIYVKMMAAFNKIAPELAKNNITVYNANVKSQLTVFEKCSIETALKDKS